MVNIITILLLTLEILTLINAEHCNEDVCGSIVSKCILTQSCKCEQRDSSCYRDCVMCMGKKYFEECCSCVDLCPKPNNMKTSLSQESHVEDLEGAPELFDVLVASPTDDLEFNWNIFTFPVDFKRGLSNRPVIPNAQQHGTVNCTVVYFDNCVSWNKCRQHCRSTGANSYRWFHDGCCECVGSTCINYGLNESRCRQCPEMDDNHEDMDSLDDGNDLYEFEIFDSDLVDKSKYKV